MSASNPTRAFDPRTDLTAEETKVVRKFVEKGKALDKPVSDGGLALSRPMASAVIGAFIIACLLILPQRAGQHPATSERAS